MRVWLLLCVALLLPGCKGKSGKGPKRITGSEERDLRAKAQRCYERGEYDCAMESLRVVNKHRPKDAQTLNQFAVAARLRYYQTGDMDFRDQELEALRKAVKLLPDSAKVQTNFGTTCWELGLRREAARAYQRVLELEPKHPDAALMRARIKRSTVEVEDEQE